MKIFPSAFFAVLMNVSALAAGQPNVVFVFTDDHSLQAIGAYGHRLSAFCKEHEITPHLDRLAAEGGLFENSLCGNSLCSPSRAASLTGLHSHANGVMTLGRPITEGLWTFPGAVKEAGYQTANTTARYSSGRMARSSVRGMRPILSLTWGRVSTMTANIPKP